MTSIAKKTAMAMQSIQSAQGSADVLNHMRETKQIVEFSDAHEKVTVFIFTDCSVLQLTHKGGEFQLSSLDPDVLASILTHYFPFDSWCESKGKRIYDDMIREESRISNK